jgi:hypothetical protein
LARSGVGAAAGLFDPAAAASVTLGRSSYRVVAAPSRAIEALAVPRADARLEALASSKAAPKLCSSDCEGPETMSPETSPTAVPRVAPGRPRPDILMSSKHGVDLVEFAGDQSRDG